MWNKSPNMFQICLVVKLLDVHHCFGRKLRPRDVKGHGAAELEWRRGAEDSRGPGCSAPLLGLESSLLTPGAGYFGGANVPGLAKSDSVYLIATLMSHGCSYIQQIFLVHLYPCYHRNNRIKEM